MDDRFVQPVRYVEPESCDHPISARVTAGYLRGADGLLYRQRVKWVALCHDCNSALSIRGHWVPL